MKNKIIKYIYISLIIITIAAFIYLLICPLKRATQFVNYDSNKTAKIKEYTEPVETVVHIENDSTFRLMYLIKELDYDNLYVSLVDENNEKIFNIDVHNYKSNLMSFEFNYLKPGDYKLLIKDLDGDPLYLSTVKSDGKSHLVNDPENTLQIVTFYKEQYNFYLWYPIFLFAFLVTIYPFVWSDKNEK